MKAARSARCAVIDDQKAIVDVLCLSLRRQGAEADGFGSAREFLASSAGPYDLILCDLVMPGMSGLQLLGDVRRKAPGTRFVMMTGQGDIATAVEAMKAGANDFLAKPIRLEEVQTLVRDLEARIAEAGTPEAGLAVGNAPVWRWLLERARRAAELPATVLLRGETGSGKEILARYIVSFGPRAGKPFVAINCAAVPETLLESELFGHAKGAFSGAEKARAGLFEEARGGTLFLDEVGSMGLAAQGKLLRVLEDRAVRRVGENHSVQVDVRIIAATNVALEAAVAGGTFRADLYFRLAVVTLNLPPLRERKEDIPLLAAHFVRELTPEGQSPKALTLEALDVLSSHAFPGNVRELRNLIEQALAFSAHSELSAADFPSLAHGAVDPGGGAHVAPAPAKLTPSRIQWALGETKGNRVHAARLLGVSRSTLYRMLRVTESAGEPS